MLVIRPGVRRSRLTRLVQIFAPETHEALAALLNKSSYSVLISYSDVEAWRRFGLRDVQARTPAMPNMKACTYRTEQVPPARSPVWHTNE